MIKFFARWMAIGIFLFIAMLLNSYLLSELKINYIFDIPYWYFYAHLVLFFPSVGMPDTSIPMTNYELVAVCSAIISNGFLYAIVLGFARKILFLFRKLMAGEI